MENLLLFFGRLHPLVVHLPIGILLLLALLELAGRWSRFPRLGEEQRTAVLACGAAAAIISMFTNLGIYQQTGGDVTGDSVGYPGYAGFELEDGIYLLWPVTWLGFLYPFFIAAGIGATIYCLWTCITLMKMRARP